MKYNAERRPRKAWAEQFNGVDVPENIISAEWHGGHLLLRDSAGHIAGTVRKGDWSVIGEDGSIAKQALDVTPSDWLAKHDEEVIDKLIAVADTERLRIAERYKSKAESSMSDMASNLDFMKIVGAVSVVRVIHAMKGNL